MGRILVAGEPGNATVEEVAPIEVRVGWWGGWVGGGVVRACVRAYSCVLGCMCVCGGGLSCIIETPSD